MAARPSSGLTGAMDLELADDHRERLVSALQLLLLLGLRLSQSNIHIKSHFPNVFM
jgi:hypothetical protein